MHDESHIDDATPPGGTGGRCARSSGDVRLAERALRESWPVPEKIRGPLISRLAIIALDKDTSPREATSAAKAIMAASRLNLDAIQATIRADEHEDLAARLAELEARLGARAQGWTPDVEEKGVADGPAEQD